MIEENQETLEIGEAWFPLWFFFLRLLLLFLLSFSGQLQYHSEALFLFISLLVLHRTVFTIMPIFLDFFAFIPLWVFRVFLLLILLCVFNCLFCFLIRLHFQGLGVCSAPLLVSLVLEWIWALWVLFEAVRFYYFHTIFVVRFDGVHLWIINLVFILIILCELIFASDFHKL